MGDRKGVFHKGHDNKGKTSTEIASNKAQSGAEIESEETKGETSTDTTSDKAQPGVKMKVEAIKYGLSKPTRKIIRARTVSNESKT
jgi:hypothetical protein